MALTEPTDAIAVDLASVYDRSGKGRKLLATLAWGDHVCVTRRGPGRVEIELEVFGEKANGGMCLLPRAGLILADSEKVLMPLEASRVLKIDFVDVHRGEGAVVETPRGKVMLVDGGDCELFARYLAARFPGTTGKKRGWKEVDCILVTHGDAGHFQGLTRIRDSEKDKESRKKLFIHPRRVYHNGIVKRGNRGGSDEGALGETVEHAGRLYLSGLESDLVKVPPARLDRAFRRWREVLKWYRKRGPVECERVGQGDDARFAFLSDGEPAPVGVRVLGPVVLRVKGKDVLPMLKKPRGFLRPVGETANAGEQGNRHYSASQTINGHAVVLRLEYGRFSLLLAGDLNAEAERALTRDHEAGKITLESDVFKVPHHGSAEISAEFLKAVAPGISVVSSGDESTRREFVYPRANLMGALGRYSRMVEPLVIVTGMVPSIETIGYVSPKEAEFRQRERPPSRFFAFRRAPFATVKIRTDGEKLLAIINSGQAGLREAYAFTKTPAGKMKVERVVQA